MATTTKSTKDKPKLSANNSKGDIKLYEKLYHDMLLIRRVEEEAARAYSQGKIGGFLHLYIGQEAIAVGTEAAIQKSDYLLTAYRDHGHAMARGMKAGAVLAELYGKDGGCVRGLGGSMHMFDAGNNFYGGHGIVGGHIALGAGFGFKAKYAKEKNISVTFFGEGATNIGGFHEPLSLAALWKLPCIFVCENNQYSMGTSAERHSPVTDFTKKALAYNMPALRVEAHDIRNVIETMSEAAEHARSGKGPIFVEALTYRFRGHSMSDPGKYRTPDEVEREKKTRDPVSIGAQILLDMGAKQARIDEINQGVESEVAEALAFAENSPPADESMIYSTIYAPTTVQY